MRVLISADMEGITGVTHPGDVLPGTPGWQYFRSLFAGDVNAAIDGFCAAGATHVVVNESHDTKRNILITELDPRATMITGTHKRLAMMEGIDSGVDAVAFVGYHAGAGHQGVLSHTYIGSTVLDVKINGETATEGRMNALLAAEFGVPTVLVTGDDKACEDAEIWAPAAQKVAVKRCVDRYTAECLPPARTKSMIADAASRALKAVTPVAKPAGPFTYEVTFDATQPVIATTGIPGVEQTGERSVAFTLGTMVEAIRCFRIVTNMAAGSTEPEYG